MHTVFYPAADRAVCHEYFHMVRGRECIYQHLQGKEYARMRSEESVYRELYAELEKYERKGVDMLLDGYQASPLQIVTACMAKEEGKYMRDYVMNPEGNIESLAFTNVKQYGQAEITP